MRRQTVAAALENHVITPQTRFDTNPGWMPNGRYRTTDTNNHGVLDTTGALAALEHVIAHVTSKPVEFGSAVRAAQEVFARQSETVGATR